MFEYDENLTAAELERRRAACDEHVTLDGKPARIGGARLKYAGVGTLDGTQHEQWAWPTVFRIIEQGGAFHT